MAVSSIFHHVILREPEEIEAFIRAAEASMADPYPRHEGPMYKVNTDPENTRRILELNAKRMKAKNENRS
ncbi:MAG: hypothetical protein IJU07_09095 [Synergistaceae bacterium]|nr:hypothetical protein [Synergistaceae bacterium]